MKESPQTSQRVSLDLKKSLLKVKNGLVLAKQINNNKFGNPLSQSQQVILDSLPKHNQSMNEDIRDHLVDYSL